MFLALESFSILKDDEVAVEAVLPFVFASKGFSPFTNENLRGEVDPIPKLSSSYKGHSGDDVSLIPSSRPP